MKDPREFLSDKGAKFHYPSTVKPCIRKSGCVESRIATYFLDTRHPDDSPEHGLGNRLYGGDDSMRIRQEYLLSVEASGTTGHGA